MAKIALLAALAAAALAPTAFAETATVSLGGQDVEIEYTATDLEVTSARLTGTSLILDVISTGNPSSLVITLDRSVIDTPESSGSQDSYIVLEDAFEIEEVEESDVTAVSRTLRIPVSTGIGEIEIFGGVVGGASAQDAPAPAVPDIVPDPAVDATPETPETPDVPSPEDPEPPAEEAAPPEEAVPDEPEPTTGEIAPPIDVAPPAPPVEPVPPVEPETPVPAPAEAPAAAAQPSTCGPGTVLADDGVTCVLSPAADRGPVSYRELVLGAGAGVVISLVAAAIMYGIGRAGRP